MSHLIGVKFCASLSLEECPLIIILGKLFILHIVSVQLKKLFENGPSYKTSTQIKNQNISSTSEPLLNLLLFTTPYPVPGVTIILTSNSTDCFCLFFFFNFYMSRACGTYSFMSGFFLLALCL